MSDVIEIPQKNILDNRSFAKLAPLYLATIGGKTLKHFISVKFEDTGNCAKLTGFMTEQSLENINTNYPKILADQPKETYVEVLYPWHKIESIRSLVFKQK